MDGPVALIGTSHVASLMDALGEWRGVLTETTRRNADLPEAFDGWHDNDLSGVDIEMRVPACLAGAETAVACYPVLAGARGHKLIERLEERDGQTRVTITPLLRDYDRRIGTAAVVISALNGNELARVMHVDDLPPYDFHPLGDAGPPPAPAAGRQPIDRADIERFLTARTTALATVLQVLRRDRPAARLLHVLRPPPLEDPERAGKTEGLARVLATHGVLDAGLRRKWYQSYCWVVGRRLRALGIEVVQPPPETATPGGFLRPELAEGLTHGNAEYGRILWRRIFEVIGGQSV